MALRRQARLRREYIYRKSLEDKERSIQDKKRKIREAIEENRKIPTELAKDALELQDKLFWDDEGGAGATSHVDDEYRWAGVEDPKIVITTSRDPSSRLRQFAKEFKLLLPNSQRLNRGRYEVSQLVGACRSNAVTDFILLHETRGQPTGMIVCHLPFGPTTYFSLSNVVMRHDLPEVEPMSEQFPHLVFHNFKTRTGERVRDILKYLFPVPKEGSRRVMTFANEDDFISFRHHTYKKMEGTDIQLKEVGPRFELRPYCIKLGTLDAIKAAETEWELRPFMNTAKKRQFLSVAAVEDEIMSFLGFGQSADVDIELNDGETRKTAEIRTEDNKRERCYLYYDGESIAGKVHVRLKKPGQKLEHQGIKVEFVGQVEIYYDRGNHLEFISLCKDLARPGDLLQHTTYPFEFSQVEKPYESYTGANVRLRYFLRVTIVRRLSDLVRELELVVHQLSTYPDHANNSIKMEVGIEDCLHIEFEYNKSKYHLKDVIVGKIYFLLVRIKIKYMEIAIIKRETVGSGMNAFNENETIAKYEIMDGAPVRGESIPIRLFLAGYDLTPSMRDISRKFSVRYYLNLVLVDEEDRRYFKQQEITLWRRAEQLTQRKPVLYAQPDLIAAHNANDARDAANAATPTTASAPKRAVQSPPPPTDDERSPDVTRIPGDGDAQNRQTTATAQ